MLTKHSHTTKDFKGCEFRYTCYTRKDRYFNPETWEFEDDIERHYVVYDCLGHPVFDADTLDDLKAQLTA